MVQAQNWNAIRFPGIELLSHSGAHLTEPSGEHPRTTHPNSDSRMCALWPVSLSRPSRLMYPPVTSPPTGSTFKPGPESSDSVPAESHRKSHSLCTLCFLPPGVRPVPLYLCPEAWPEKKSIWAGCQRVTQKSNVPRPSHFVSPVSEWRTLATLPNLPCLKFLFGEGGRLFSGA